MPGECARVRPRAVRVLHSPSHRVHPASFFVAGDELVVPRPDGNRGGEGLASPREILDRRGNLWTLREKHLTRAWTARHLAPRTLARAARGWLLFENGTRRIIVT